MTSTLPSPAADSTPSPKLESRRPPPPRLPIVSPGDVPPTFDWAFFFPQRAESADPAPAESPAESRAARPLEIEIGTGKGGFLQQATAARPGTDWLGIDYAGKYLRLAALRLGREAAARGGPANVALYYGKFEAFFAELPPATVDAIHIYFPDPWHKKKQQKRRMLREDSLHWFHRALRPGGRLLLRTDVPTYFTAMQEELAEAASGFAIDETLVYHELPRAQWWPTNYERRFLADGLTCHAIAARKRVAHDTSPAAGVAELRAGAAGS